MDKYARQRGLVAQDVIADADVQVYGSGPTLPYLLQCLAFAGVASRHGQIRLAPERRKVEEADLFGQFLLRPDDLGKPIGDALVDRVTVIDQAIDIAVGEGSARCSIAVAVPRPSEIHELTRRGSINACGQVYATSLHIGPAPLPAEDFAPNVLTGALSAICGGLLAQTVLCQLGAIVDGPAVLSSWFEERLWVSYPGIGNHARSALADGAEAPSFRGLLERTASPEMADRIRVDVDGSRVDPRVTAIIDDDAVVITVPVSGGVPALRRAELRPSRRMPGPVTSQFWSPMEGAGERDGHQLENDSVRLPEGTSCRRIVVCGVGALGSWASAVIAASGIPGIELCLVDMDGAVERHNLNRQVLFGDADLGQPKAQRAMARLTEINPKMGIKAFQVMVSPDLIDDLVHGPGRYEIADEVLGQMRSAYQQQIVGLAAELGGAAAVLSCPDNHQTRWSLNVIAEHLAIPLVNGAVDGFVGRVHVCDPNDRGRCLVCWLGESIAREPDRRSCTDVFDAAPVPSIVTSAAVVGGAQAAMAIAHFLDWDARLKRFHAFDGIAGTLEGWRAADRDPDECPAHLTGRIQSTGGPGLAASKGVA